MKRRRTLLPGILIVVFASLTVLVSHLSADTIFLTTGETLQGKILTQSRTQVQIQLSSGEVRLISKDGIRRIAYGATPEELEAQRKAQEEARRAWENAQKKQAEALEAQRRAAYLKTVLGPEQITWELIHRDYRNVLPGETDEPVPIVARPTGDMWDRMCSQPRRGLLPVVCSLQHGSGHPFLAHGIGAAKTLLLLAALDVGSSTRVRRQGLGWNVYENATFSTDPTQMSVINRYGYRGGITGFGWVAPSHVGLFTADSNYDRRTAAQTELRSITAAFVVSYAIVYAADVVLAYRRGRPILSAREGDNTAPTFAFLPSYAPAASTSAGLRPAEMQWNAALRTNF